jgi:hypothetical protein
VIETYGVVDVAALGVITTKAGGGWDIWVHTSGCKVEVADVDGATITEAEIRVDWNGVHVSPRVPELEIEQPSMLPWEVASFARLSGEALIECSQEGGLCGMDIPGNSVRGAVRTVEWQCTPSLRWRRVKKRSEAQSRVKGSCWNT